MKEIKELEMMLKKVLAAIEEIKGEEAFPAQLKNVLRGYYLGLDNIFIVNRILNKINLAALDLGSSEKIHIENAGWLLDQKYVDDVYVMLLKTNLILDAWVVFRSNKLTEKNKDFSKWFEILVASIHNNSKGTADGDFVIDGETLKIKKDQEIQGIDLEIVLSLVRKMFEISITE